MSVQLWTYGTHTIWLGNIWTAMFVAALTFHGILGEINFFVCFSQLLIKFF